MKRAHQLLAIATATIGLAAWAPLNAQAPPPPPPPPRAAVEADQALADAAIAAQRQDFATARALLEKVPKTDGPRATEIEARRLFQLAALDQLEFEAGRADAAALERAAEGYKRVLVLRPHTPAALYNLGRIYDQRGDVGAAAKLYAAAAEQKGANQAFYAGKYADYAAKAERWPVAEEAYQRAVLIDPQLEEPHRILSERYLARPQDSALLDYLWKLVANRQEDRAEDLALRAIENRWPEKSQTELLTVVAAGLGQRPLAPAALLESSIGHRLAALTDNAKVGPGARELLKLYQSPNSGPIGRFEWWDQNYLDEWADRRGIARRDAIRMVLRSVGDWYQQKGDSSTAALCYRAAVDDAHPDPVALRKLADVYVEKNDLDGLNSLAELYASPEGKLFEAKNEAYRTGQLETVLEYHRTLGRIYGNLAANGRGSWGTTSKYDSAMFQLTRAYDVGQQLDRKHAGDKDAPASYVDPDLTVLLAKGYQATGNAAAGNDVRLEAAERYEKVGDTRARDKVLRNIPTDTLTTDQKKKYQIYRPNALNTTGGSVDTTVGSEDAAKRTAGGVHATGIGAVAGSRLAQRTLDVPANQLWVDTGLDVKEGQALDIQATGQWSNSGPPSIGPAGFAGYRYAGTVAADADLGALIARIGERVFQVGAGFHGAAPTSGRLSLSINDTPDTYGDNQGALSVVIKLE